MTNPVLTNVRARVRQAVARATLPERAADHPGRFAWERHDATTIDERVARFTRELEPLGGKVLRVPTEGAARDAVVALAEEAGTTGVLAWSDDHVGLSGLSAALRARDSTNAAFRSCGFR